MGAECLDDEDVPALTTGQAADVLGVRPAFLRSLDAGRMLRPARSAGGHRRRSRRQPALAARLRALSDEGPTLTAAWKVVTLEDRVDEVTRERDLARSELERTRREPARGRREPAGTRTTGAARAGERAGDVRSGPEHTARVPSSVPAHRGSGHRRPAGSVPAARPSITPATTTDTVTP